MAPSLQLWHALNFSHNYCETLHNSLYWNVRRSSCSAPMTTIPVFASILWDSSDLSSKYLTFFNYYVRTLLSCILARKSNVSCEPINYPPCFITLTAAWQIVNLSREFPFRNHFESNPNLGLHLRASHCLWSFEWWCRNVGCDPWGASHTTWILISSCSAAHQKWRSTPTTTRAKEFSNNG